jgi:hypothetical protein
MPRKRYTPEEIVAKLRQVDVLVSQGQNIADAIRQIGVSEVACAMSCSMVKSSTRCARPGSLSKVGGVTSTRSGRMSLSATSHPHRKCSCQPSPSGRLRYADRLRRPRWRNGQLSTNIPPGPLSGVRPVDHPPPLKWSDVKYVFWHQGGPICRGRGTRLKRSSRSCGRSKSWSRRARTSLTLSARSA